MIVEMKDKLDFIYLVLILVSAISLMIILNSLPGMLLVISLILSYEAFTAKIISRDYKKRK